MNRLFVNALKSVGLVSSGDDPEASVTFWKSADLDEMRPDPDDVSKLVPSAESTRIKTGFTMADLDLSAIEDTDLRKSIEDALSEKDDLSKQVAELTEKLEEMTPEPDPIEKADDEVKALIEKERKEREELQKRYEETVAKQRHKEFVSKAEDLKYALGKPEDIAEHLEKIEAAAPESFAVLEGALQTAANRVKAATEQGLFKELGTEEGDGEFDYESKRDAWVEKNRKDDEPIEVARARFLKTEEGRIAKQEAR